MENPLPIAVDFPNQNIQIEFDAPQADAINADSPNPTGDLSDSHRNGTIIRPHSLLPKPDAPRGLLKMLLSFPEKFDSPASPIGKLFWAKSSSVSEALKRISSLTKDGNGEEEEEDLLVKEFDLVGFKVVKTLKQGTKELNGRISFFSRSNCRDCTAVRSFLRERDLSSVEINIDVYLGREKELRERTGGDSVPQLFFNEKLIGGLAGCWRLNWRRFWRRSAPMTRRCRDSTRKARWRRWMRWRRL